MSLQWIAIVIMAIFVAVSVLAHTLELELGSFLMGTSCIAILFGYMASVLLERMGGMKFGLMDTIATSAQVALVVVVGLVIGLATLRWRKIRQGGGSK